MRALQATAVTTIVLVLVLAGCAAPADPTESAKASTNVVAPPGAPEEWLPGLAGIEASVVDDEGLPLANASVAIYEPFLLEAVADAKGAVRFERLEPGTYKIAAAAPGHQGAARKVDVVADEIERIVLVLAPFAIIEPYHVPFIDDGLHVLCVAPFPFGIAGSCNGASVGPLAGEKSRFTHPGQTNLTGYVGELVWQSNSLLGAKFMDLSANDATSSTPSKEFYGYRTGMSPVRLRIAVDPIDRAFNVTSRVDVNYDCDTGRVNNCTANLPSSMYAIDFQQRFKLYSAHFHYAAPPEDYTSLPDT